ncbi:glycoside hydrolase family 76 protein [Xylariaceae sp. FL1019]|nr:glycoside hydrolase family 76 protein [Xylariaceae sp. FL1019]
MVASSYVGGIAARALAISSVKWRRTTKAEYMSDTTNAIKTLQGWYDSSSGLWSGTGWWNSANCLTVLADYGLLDSSFSQSYNIPGIISTTYNNAPKSNSNFISMIDSAFRSICITNYKLDDYYDDEGWWALAFIRSYDLTGQQSYLNQAVTIFNDMKGGSSPCGGIYWDKPHTYTNAIANELYMKAAASLANRIPADKSSYVSIAQSEWNWFKSTGLVNSDNLINDGLTSSCTNNGEKTWTYNQGVILGALAELYKANGDSSLLTSATNIANAAILTLVSGGILSDGCEPDCGADGEQFKGVFMRNLQELHKVAPSSTFSNFIIKNADSIWSDDNNNYHLGQTWQGPYEEADAGSQSSALDALVAAVAVS